MRNSTSFERTLKRLRRSASNLFGAFWGLAFRLTGSLKYSRARRWSSAGGERVIVIAPHPDDEAIACSGAMARHLKARDDVLVVIATDGRLSRQAAGPDEMASLRAREARDAAKAIGVERLVCLGLHEGRWRLDELSGSLSEIFADWGPTIVYAPSRIDFHPEHLAVARALGMTLESTCHKRYQAPLIRIYQVQVPLTRALTNLVVDITDGIARSEAALRAYRSQTGSIEFVERRRRYSAGMYRVVGPVEEFWELTADQYVMLHDASSLECTSRFRGLRRFAWTDPLAYIVGHRERRRLRSLILSRKPAPEPSCG